MSRLAWLSPDNPPDGIRSILLWVPSGEEWEQAIRGALTPLIDPDNWEQLGSYSPAAAAAEFEYPLYLTMRWEAARMIGEIFLYAANSVPIGALLCNGALVSQATYAALYAVIGDTFGSDGSGNFRLPDLRGRVPVGAGTGAGLTARSLADTGGEESHQLTVAEMPAHDHTVHSHSTPLVTGLEIAPVSTPGLTSGFTGNSGSDQPHENMPPFLALNYYIYAG